MTFGIRNDAVVFSPWYRWSLADKLDDYRFAGVYAIARFDSAPVGPGDPLVAETVYIGETCGQTLGDRLHQFDRSAFRQKSGHSGGWTYGSRFTDDDSVVYFSMFAVRGLASDIAPFFIRHVERALIWSYVKRWNRPPCCNSK